MCGDAASDPSMHDIASQILKDEERDMIQRMDNALDIITENSLAYVVGIMAEHPNDWQDIARRDIERGRR